jgi:hypothetical protein
MRIAIPVLNLGKGKYTIVETLNAKGQLCIYEGETQKSQWLKISDLVSDLNELFSTFQQKSITDIISAKMQPMALKILVDKGFQVYMSQGNDLKKNIDLHEKGQLYKFDMQHLLANINLCEGACNTCETSCDDTTEKETKKQ